MAMQAVSWSPEEDQALATAVQRNGTKKWKAVKADVVRSLVEFKKNFKQCRERWFNHLNPSISKAPVTEDEKQLIFRLHQVYGNKWNTIAKQLHGRPDNTVKTVFYAELKKAVRRHNKANPKNRVLRTLKSLVRDQQVTVKFNLVRSPSCPPGDTQEISTARLFQEPAKLLPPLCCVEEKPQLDWEVYQQEWTQWWLALPRGGD